MTPPEQVEATLHHLCRRARVTPDDDSAAAARRVIAILRRDGVFRWDRSLVPCPLSAWLGEASGVCGPTADRGRDRVALTVSHAVVTYTRGGVRARTVLALPKVVEVAVRLCLVAGNFREPADKGRATA